MQNWFTGKGYGISDQKDFNGRPFLTFQGPNDKIPVTLYDRVAQTFDFTIAQSLRAGEMKNDRFDGGTATAVKKILGGGSDDELDHKISLELGGSNSPANLWIQHGITAGASAASDQLENGLALDVVNGKISLETAWTTLSEQKGFLMSENIIFTQTLDNTSFLDIAKSVLKSTGFNLISLLNPLSIGGFNLSSFFGGTTQIQTIQPVNTQLKSQLDDLILQLKSTPLNQPLLTKIFQTQVQLTAQQLQISNTEAGKTVSTYLAGYAQSKGIDAKGMMGAMNADIQKIIAASNSNPNVLGISSVTITKIVAALQTVSVTLVGGGITLAIIGIFMAGPTAVLAALSGGLLESIGAIFGVSAITGIGLTSFAVGEAFNVASIGLNMSVKAMYDNQYLLPTQQISALKDALAIQKGLAAFLPSEKGSSATVTKSGTGTSGGNNGSGKVSVFTGVVSSGVLGAGLAFTPRTAGIIENMTDLNAAVQNNLAPFLAALPSLVTYDIKITAHIINEDGITQRGASHKIQTGTHKNGTPIYKTVINKYAVVELYIKTDKGTRTKIKTIVLGPTDAGKFQPTETDLSKLSNTIQGTIHTTSTDQIHTVVSSTPTAATTPAAIPASTQTTQTTAPTQTAQQIPKKTYGFTIERLKNPGTTPAQIDEVGYAEIATLQQEYQTFFPEDIAGFNNFGGNIESLRLKLHQFINGTLDPAHSQIFKNYMAQVVKDLTSPASTQTTQTTAPTTQTKKGATATTLNDWYIAQGTVLPSLSVRAKLYEDYKFGPANLYVGSEEQNTQLLAALKAA